VAVQIGQAEQVGNDNVMSWMWDCNRRVQECRGVPREAVGLSWMATAAGKTKKGQLLVQQLILFKKWKPAALRAGRNTQNGSTQAE